MSDKKHPCLDNCCDNSDVRTPEHDHDENNDEFCILCWTTQCLNCGEACECNL